MLVGERPDQVAIFIALGWEPINGKRGCAMKNLIRHQNLFMTATTGVIFAIWLMLV